MKYMYKNSQETLSPNLSKSIFRAQPSASNMSLQPTSAWSVQTFDHVVRARPSTDPFIVFIMLGTLPDVYSSFMIRRMMMMPIQSKTSFLLPLIFPKHDTHGATCRDKGASWRVSEVKSVFQGA